MTKKQKRAKIASLALGTLSLVAAANSVPEAMAQTAPTVGVQSSATLSESSANLLLNSPAPLPVNSSNQLAQTQLRDIRGHWAETFIRVLAQQRIIAGFPDGNYRPDQLVTRAQFASIINNAFDQPAERQAIRFVDVPRNFWATNKIEQAYRMGFLEGFPGGRFGPNQNIIRVNSLIALASGLDLNPTGNVTNILNVFQDAASIPNYARNGTAAATQNQLVVNYPNPNTLNPQRQATRADIAAFVYQALVDQGRLTAINESNRASRFIVGFRGDELARPPEKPPIRPETPRLSRAQLTALRDRVAELDNTTDLRQIFLGAPAVNGGSPSAFGAYWGTIYTALSYQAETRNNGNDDGAVAFGFGLGTPEVVGLDTTITSLSTLDSGFFERVGVSFKLHRAFKGDFGVAAGIENLILSEDSDSTSSGFGVVGKVFKLKPSTREAFSRVNLSVGVGGGRFRAFDNLDEDTLGVFGSVGLRVFEPLSVFADWTGQDLNAGLSVVPIRHFPLVITPVFQDLTGEANDEVRFSVTVGASYSF